MKRFRALIRAYTGNTEAEKQPIYECDWCGYGIYSGDEYVELDDDVRVCGKCIDFYTERAVGKI